LFFLIQLWNVLSHIWNEEPYVAVLVAMVLPFLIWVLFIGDRILFLGLN